MSGAGGVNMEQFEAYFQRADLDRDGKISGAEAVSFFQGSGLSKQVLAQIWQYADQNRSGYLGRPEFYNALKLVTVAQSKRDLTPDIVKAALYGPASAKIPAPRINLAATPSPQPNSGVALATPQLGAPSLPSPQALGFRGQAPSVTSVNQQFGLAPSTAGTNQQFRQAQPSSTGQSQQFGLAQSSSTGMNQQFRPARPLSPGMNQQFGQAQPVTNTNQNIAPSPGSQSTRPPVLPSISAAAAPRPIQSVGSPSFPSGGSLISSSNDWFGGKTGAASTGTIPQVLNSGPSPSIPSVGSNPQDQISTFSSTTAKDPKGFVGSGNRSALDSMFGGDVFAVNQSSSQQVSSAPQLPASNLPTSSAIVPVTATPQPSAKLDPFEALQSNLLKSTSGVQAPQKPPLPKSQVPTQVTSTFLSSGVPAGLVNPTSEQSQISWPKMTRASIQKYAKVFMEVDTDRDGKITGEQARNLFLSWRLPREVLKQVWDLSDQDSDSMLSLREFCVALYLMERYREGRPLPSALPNSVMLDETLLSLAGPPTAYGMTGWGSTTGFRPPQGMHGAQPGTPAGLRPPMQPMYSQADGQMQYQQNARGPIVDNSRANQLVNEGENSLDNKAQEAIETNEKVDNNENILLDSKEKLEFYRTKMQDLVLYKSRCDNRLNEITERARADKGEAETLEKKYQEKYKQVSEIHSKLTIEEASFREIQARKMELQQAIVKVEQGGSADGILQVRADRIQSDLEELLKALTDRCKKHGFELKSSALIELPAGWQPGIPEFAALWDEDWDKFEDEGFSFDVAVPANSNSTSTQMENSSPAHTFSADSPSNSDTKSGKPFSNIASVFETESIYSADESKSPRSPERQTPGESPSQEYSPNHFRKNSDEDAETHRSFDEPSWGNFDNNDDIDSVWGMNAKESDHGKHNEKYFFGSKDFDASPESTYSPRSDSAFQKNSPFAFEDSVPGSPVSRTATSPRYSMESRGDPFDSFSRYDSFSTHDHGSSPRRQNLSRFDSINSTNSFNQRSNYSFDDSDPFGSSGPFKVSSISPK